MNRFNSYLNSCSRAACSGVVASGFFGGRQQLELQAIVEDFGFSGEFWVGTEEAEVLGDVEDS